MSRPEGANRALVLVLLSLIVGLLGPFAVWAGVRSLRERASVRAWIGLVSGAVTTGFALLGIGWFLASALL